MFVYGLFLTCLFFNIQASDVAPFSYTSSEATTPLNDSTEVVPFTYVSSGTATPLNDSYVVELPLSIGSRASTRTWGSQNELNPNMQHLQSEEARNASIDQDLPQRLETTPNTQPASPNMVQSPTYNQATPVEPKTIPTTPVMQQPARSMKIFNPKGAKESEKLRATLQAERDEKFFTQKADRIKKLLESNLTNDQKERTLIRKQTNRRAHASSYMLDNSFVNLLSQKKDILHTDTNIDISPNRVHDTKRSTLEAQSSEIGSQISDLRSIPSSPDIKNRIRILLKELKLIHSKLATHHEELAKKSEPIIAELRIKANRFKQPIMKLQAEHDLRKAIIALEYHLAQQRMHQNIIRDIYEQLDSLK